MILLVFTLLCITTVAATDSSNQTSDTDQSSNDVSTTTADTKAGNSNDVSKNTDNICTESENELISTDTTQSTSNDVSSTSTTQSTGTNSSTSKSLSTSSSTTQSSNTDVSTTESDGKVNSSSQSDYKADSTSQTSNTNTTSSIDEVSVSNDTGSFSSINNITSDKSLKEDAKASVTIKVGSITASVDDSVVFKANVTASNGVVVNDVLGVFKLNGVSIGYANVTNGVAQLKYTIPNWSAKDYTITFKVGETVTTKSAEANSTLTIYKNAVKASVNSITSLPNTQVTFKASVNYTNGTPLTGNVKGVFKVNGVTIGYGYVNDGVATYTYTIPSWSAKNYNITFTVGESRTSLEGSAKGVLTLYKDNVTVSMSSYNAKPNSQITIKATAYYSKGVALDGQKVSFKLNGKTIGSTRVVNGVAQINYTTPSKYGVQNLTVIIGESGSSNTATANSKLVLCDTGVIKINELFFMKKGNEVTMKVSVVGSNGVYATDGKVCLKINGKTVDTVSITNGNATFTYDTSKLSTGTHNITVIYGSSNYLSSVNATSNLRITTNTTKFTYSQILQKASDTKTFIEKNNRLPNYVTVGSTKVSVEDFFYLLCEVYADNNTYYTGAFSSSTTSKTNCNGAEISKDDYITLANIIVDCYAQNGRAPHNISIGNRTLSYDDAFYLFVRAVAYIDSNGRMSNYGTVIAISNASSTTSGNSSGSSSTNKVPSGYEKYVQKTANCQVNNSAIKSAVETATKGVTGTYNQAVAIFNYVNSKTSYSGYYNTKYGAVGTLSRGYGNCCDLSHLLVAMFRTANIPARYCHAKCTFSSGSVIGHVWVEVYVDGKWYSCDASSSRNSFGVIKNWSKSTSVTRYTELPF